MNPNIFKGRLRTDFLEEECEDIMASIEHAEEVIEHKKFKTPHIALYFRIIFPKRHEGKKFIYRLYQSFPWAAKAVARACGCVDSLGNIDEDSVPKGFIQKVIKFDLIRNIDRPQYLNVVKIRKYIPTAGEMLKYKPRMFSFEDFVLPEEFKGEVPKDIQ